MVVFLALAALIVILLTFRAVRKSKRAARALEEAKLPVGELVSIDAIREDLADLRQDNIVCARHGISGRPDRIIRTANGITPVELKSGNAPRNGPYETQLAQLAVYCLLMEERFQTTVKEGMIQYSDRSVTVAYDDQIRSWILRLIREVQNAKSRSDKTRRSHNQPGKCRGCGFRKLCSEALP